MTGNNTLTYRVGQLEEKVEKLEERLGNKLELLMTNDIPHLQQEIISVKTKMNVLTAVNIGAIILGIIISRFLI